MLFRQLSIAVFFLFGFTILTGQISAPYADYIDLTEYTIEDSDSIFLFHRENDSVFIMVDTSQSPDYLSLSWEEFVPGIGYQYLNFQPKIFVTPDTIAKGFRLTVYNASDTIVTRCWVLRNEFTVHILTKDDEGNLANGVYTSECNKYGPIQVKIDQAQLWYFHPATYEKYDYEPDYKKIWEKDQDVEEGQVVERGKIFDNFKFNVEDAYWEDMWYTFVVSDSCGNEDQDSVFVRSINPKADFEYEHVSLDDKTYYPDKDTNYYFFYSSKNYEEKDHISAPAYYIFKNKSENAHEYFWTFGDSTTYRTTSDSVLKEYTKIGSFEVTLTAEHHVLWWNQTCTSTMTLDETVDISLPILHAPNVFCVNSSKYPAWRFEEVSITDFEISIFSRNGVRVHHFKGNIRDWDGWDGRYKNTDSYVSDGVYFYIVKNFSHLDYYDEDYVADDYSVWTGTSGGGEEENNDKKEEKKNNQYRGFFHVYCSE
ncbi:MAG: gliding motility-associated C-terminal domain-containing protein [Bacteroidales bacterium]|nr:gliding motility-associated C-terminal domain-containing protein [Bacteroidales bacterium]MBN2818123.1 gliding motility-associated C-terminal domain-containing protein [Bacteroidales bacterium]